MAIKMEDMPEPVQGYARNIKQAIANRTLNSQAAYYNNLFERYPCLFEVIAEQQLEMTLLTYAYYHGISDIFFLPKATKLPEYVNLPDPGGERAISIAVKKTNAREHLYALLRAGADITLRKTGTIFSETALGNAVRAAREKLEGKFSYEYPPLREDCFAYQNKASANLLAVCALGEFQHYVGNPLIRDRSPENLALYRDILANLPSYWQNKFAHQCTLIERAASMHAFDPKSLSV